MNTANGKPGWSWSLGAGREVPGGRPDRRKFRPSVAGLEGRQLLTATSLSTLATLHGANQSLVGNVVTDAQGDLFGSTSDGGPGGGTGNATVFEIPQGSKTPTTIATSKDSNGYNIGGLTLDGQGDLIGTIGGEGGPYGDGQVFEIAQGSKAVSTIAPSTGPTARSPPAS